MDARAIANVFGQTDRELWLVTSEHGGQRGGLIATTVSHASIVPELPRVLVGLARQHHTHSLVEAGGRFVLHLLGEEHLGWVWLFGLQTGRHVDKLAQMEVAQTARGQPRLVGARAWLECRVETALDFGDRTVFVGEVLDGIVDKPAPLLTMKTLLQLAPPERLRQLKEQMDRDAAVDRDAVLEWREQKKTP